VCLTSTPNRTWRKCLSLMRKRCCSLMMARTSGCNRSEKRMVKAIARRCAALTSAIGRQPFPLLGLTMFADSLVQTQQGAQPSEASQERQQAEHTRPHAPISTLFAKKPAHLWGGWHMSGCKDGPQSSPKAGIAVSQVSQSRRYRSLAGIALSQPTSPTSRPIARATGARPRPRRGARRGRA
jgi:hypothetical protein